MDETNIDSFRQAGKIAAMVREDSKRLIMVGESLLDVVETIEEALENAIAMIKPDVGVGEVGETIENTITRYGFKPISNLSGHMIKSKELHAGVEIPNIKTKDPYKFQEGDIFAVEPFATNGQGFVEELDEVEIFSVHMPASVRMRQSRKIIDYVLKNYGTLPFAERWIRKEFKSKLLVSASLRELLQSQFIRAYPVLREVSRGLVSQAEHTVLVSAEGCEVLTK
jgi:methionyl aminopeptidase